jgi:hypothetical protein
MGIRYWITPWAVASHCIADRDSGCAKQIEPLPFFPHGFRSNTFCLSD